MAKNWAVCIGVNQYRFMQPLNYAVNDATKMAQWFRKQAKFDNVYLFTDTSPPIEDMSFPFESKPDRDTLLYWFGKRFSRPFLSLDDNLWFFFSGHGMRQGGKEYLMLSGSDASPGNIEHTAISINYINEKLRLCGAGNVMMLIDACRESTKGIGFELHKQQGIISIASCSPNELSYEISALEHGSFTYALLESLTFQGEGNCATVERLCKRLRSRVTELNLQYNKPRQTPYAVVEPETKYHLILLPNYLQPTDADIALLREDAYKAEVKGDLRLAETMWRRLVKFDSEEAIESILRIQKKLEQQPNTINLPSPVVKDSSSVKSPIQDVGFPSSTQPTLKTAKADYTKLRDLLAAGKWKEADEETAKVMLKVANREEEGLLRGEDLDRFPYQDLRKIDRLWVNYSKGKFGFSVQKKIYQSLGGTREYNEEIWNKFGDTVGWRVNNNWVYYNEMPFSLDAPKGNLPEVFIVEYGWGQSLLSRPDL